MSELRQGRYGPYYGSRWGESSTLSWEEMQVNATYIYSYLVDHGWTPEAVAGLLGNLQNESAINPGRWEGDDVGGGPGYGLVQWTPYSKYVDWCTSRGYTDPSEMDNNLARILWELETGEQYYATDSYPLSFEAFSKSTDSPYTLACAFAWNYERSWVVLYGSEAEKEALRQARGGDGETWYEYLTGVEPTPPTPGGKTHKHKMSLLLMYTAIRRRK